MERRLNQSSFDQWMRTGLAPRPSDRAERKFNPHNDPDDGRFTFGPGSAGVLRPRQISLQSRSAVQARHVASAASRKVSTDPIGDIIERELRGSSDTHVTSGDSAIQVGAKRVKRVLTHWPIAGTSEAMLNRADKPDEGDPHYGTGRKRGKHGGIDIKAPSGTAVRAAGKGIVVGIAPNPSQTFGEQIGSVGRSGNTPKLGESHLHFEVRIGSPRPASTGGTTHNPLSYLPK